MSLSFSKSKFVNSPFIAPFQVLACCALICTVVVSGLNVTAVAADREPAGRYRYVDISGNIYWVSRFSDVPSQYRNQIKKRPDNQLNEDAAKRAKSASSYSTSIPLKQDTLPRGGMTNVWRSRSGSYSGL